MTRECRRTVDVERGMGSGQWSPDLADHVAGCEACRETRRVLDFMDRLAADDPRAAVPPAGVVFLRAQVRDRLRRESEALEEAGKPLRLAGAIAGAVILAGLALASGWMSGHAPAPLVPWLSPPLAVLLAAGALLVARSWGSHQG